MIIGTLEASEMMVADKRIDFPPGRCGPNLSLIRVKSPGATSAIPKSGVLVPLSKSTMNFPRNTMVLFFGSLEGPPLFPPLVG
jgi:hypothetical protein